MSIMKGLGELFSPNDPKIIRETVARIDEQDRWNDVFSTKLIELLDKIDAVKSDIRERLRLAGCAIVEMNVLKSDALERLRLVESATDQINALKSEIRQRLKFVESEMLSAVALTQTAKTQFETAEAKNDAAHKAAETENTAARGRLLEAIKNEGTAATNYLHAQLLFKTTAQISIIAVVTCLLIMFWTIFLALRPAVAVWLPSGLTFAVIGLMIVAFRRLK